MTQLQHRIQSLIAATKATVKVSFNANGGSGSMVAVDRASGNYTLPANTLSRSGYSFLGWKINNTGTTYTAGQIIAINADTVLYAQWDSLYWTVYFTSVHGTGKTINSPIMVYKGHTFFFPYATDGSSVAIYGSGAYYLGPSGTAYTLQSHEMFGY